MWHPPVLPLIFSQCGALAINGTEADEDDMETEGKMEMALNFHGSATPAQEEAVQRKRKRLSGTAADWSCPASD
jgi:hypothetical protein